MPITTHYSPLTTHQSPADAQARAFQQGFDLFTRDPVEVAGDRMLEGTGGHAVIEALLHVVIEQAMNKSGREGVAGAQAVHDLHLVAARPEELALLVSDARPAILPHERILTQRNG